MKKLFAIFLVSCITITQAGCIGKLFIPKTTPVIDNVWAIDSSTPPQYDEHLGGFLGFVGDKGLLAPSLKMKYNALISLYGDQFYEEKAVRLARNAGIEDYQDQHGNNLYLIDGEHLVYFIILKRWSNELRPPDK